MRSKVKITIMTRLDFLFYLSHRYGKKSKLGDKSLFLTVLSYDVFLNLNES